MNSEISQQEKDSGTEESQPTEIKEAEGEESKAGTVGRNLS
jgi:hypothetical protein